MFLDRLGYNRQGFRNLTLFDPDDPARLFLERELGLEQANPLMKERVPVWRWRARWYRPPDKEEFRVWLAPDGRVIGYAHTIADEAPGTRLEPVQARKLAEAFLETQAIAGLRIVAEESEEKPNRRDHVFSWEREDFRVKEATLRLSVAVRGNRVEGFLESLKVPEAWERDFAALRSKNELYTRIAQVFEGGLLLAAVVLMIHWARRRELSWQQVLPAAALVGVLTMLTQWNSLPFYLDDMPTSTPSGEGVISALLQGVGAGMGILILVLLTGTAGEPLYRRILPDRLSLRSLFSRDGMQTREFFRACVTGYAMAAGHLAFITAFYLAGRQFGVWSPQDVEYSNLLSTFAPWLDPLTISVEASIWEEFTFRLLAIPLLWQVLKSRWLAMILPAFLWGFLHANYPQQPAYIRGVEVGLIGVAAGWMMLRFGIGATLVWHYTVDALLIGSYLWTAEGWIFRISGYAVGGAILGPFVYALWRYRRSGGFLRAETLANWTLESPKVRDEHREPVEAPGPPLAPIWPPPLLYAVAGVLCVAAIWATPREFGDFLRVSVTKEEALAAAGGPPKSGLVSVNYVANLSEEVFEYLRRQAGATEANRIVRDYQWTGLWRIRYFEPGQKQEHHIYVDQNKRVVREDWVLDEKTAGAKLSSSQARSIGESYLSARGIRFEKWKLSDTSEQVRDHRTDHHFVWENTEFRSGDSRARISLEILGDRPSHFRRYLHLPDHWLREFRRPRLTGYLVPAILGGFLLLVVLLFFRHVRELDPRWKRYACFGAGAAFLLALSYANRMPTFFENYDTSQPVQDYVWDAILQSILIAVAFGALITLAAMAADLFLRLALGNRRMNPLSMPTVAALCALLWAAPRIALWIDGQIPGDRSGVRLWSAPPVATAWPTVDVMISSALTALMVSLAAAILVPAAYVLFSGRQRFGYALVIAAFLAASRSSSWHLSLVTFLLVLAGFGLISLITRTAGVSLVALALAVFLQSSVAGLWLARRPERPQQPEDLPHIRVRMRASLHQP